MTGIAELGLRSLGTVCGDVDDVVVGVVRANLGFELVVELEGSNK
jgi:hypothetical protein